ncbi:MAG: magnesium/cobalt transporter CorA [Negativicutes bacterium]|jgi:magnesium transporter
MISTKQYLIKFNDTECVRMEISPTDFVNIQIELGSTYWVQVFGEGERGYDQFENVCTKFVKSIPLIYDDDASTIQRPYMKVADEYIFLSLKNIYLQPTGEITDRQLCFLQGKNYLISYSDRETAEYGQIYRDMKAANDREKWQETDYLMSQVINDSVDNYFVVVHNIGHRIDAFEHSIVEAGTIKPSRSVNNLKKDILKLRGIVSPTREVIARLLRTESKLIKRENKDYFQLGYEDIMYFMDSLDIYRDMLSGLMELHLSYINNRTNDIMKFLTMISTVFIPLSFITGLYGMNFDNMIGLHTEYGYFIVCFLMIAILFGLLVYFKKKSWF